jgi:CubicO group peptidase (beta-lactamase class C family)
MGLNPLIDYDWNFSDFTGRVKELVPQGFRLLSLSMYGDPFNSRFAAVWDKRSGPEWRWYLGYTIADFEKLYQDNRIDQFYPVLVTATGGGSNTRISGVFEQMASSQATELTLNQSLEAFNTEVANRAEQGWLIRNATICDDPQHPPTVAAVWERNTQNVAWNAFAGLSGAEHQTYFGVEWSGWARLAFVTASTQHRFLAIYRDDQIGPIGQGFIARHNLALNDFLAEQKSQLANGFYTTCFQGYGPDTNRGYAAIFVNNEVPVARTQRITGEPQVPEIDQAVLELMKKSNIRGASLAIVKDTRLVLARSYTWAEPDYPTAQPTTCFRLASCSKLVAALALHQLADEGAVKLTDLLPNVLPLKTPDNKPPSTPAYYDTTVRKLLENDCRLNPDYEGKDDLVVAAFGAQVPATHAQIASFMMTQPQTDKKGPNDGGFFLAAEVVKKARGIKSFFEAVEAGINKPLSIKRLRVARTNLSAQPSGEARYHSRELGVRTSVMSPDRPVVPQGYGEYNLETMEASGGLSAAAPDLARILAAMNSKPQSPLGRKAVEALLKGAVEGQGGHGFDALQPIDASKELYRAWKGGLLDVAQSGLYYENGGVCYVILWNGLHTGSRLRSLDPALGGSWYPIFNKVLDLARKHTWPATDLFPKYNMPSLEGVRKVRVMATIPNATFKVNGNGSVGSLTLSVDGAGNVTGTIYNDKISGFWDEDAKKITFLRIPNSGNPDAYQIYTGYWWLNNLADLGLGSGLRHTLAGSFEAFKGTGAVAQRVLYGWFAQLDLPIA